MSKHVAISGATRRRDTAEVTRGREDLDRLFATRVGDDHIDADAVAEDAVDDDAEEATPPLDASELADDDAEGDDLSVDDAMGGATTPGGPGLAVPVDGAGAAASPQALIERCRSRMDTLHADDREEAEQLVSRLAAAISTNDPQAVTQASDRLGEFLFFIEAQ